MHPLVSRFNQAIITVFAAITLGFVLIHQLPSGPMQVLIAVYGQERVANMSPETIERLSDQYTGFNAEAPLMQQYIEYMTGIFLRGEFGVSVIYGEPVMEVLAPAVPWTVFLSFTAMLFNTTLGISIGAYMAYRQGSRFDVGGTTLTVVLSSIPYYIIAVLLLVFLGFQTPIFPTGGRIGNDVPIGLNLQFIVSALRHVALPFLSLSFTGFAALGIRAHGIRVLGSDYIRVARLRGLSERRVVFHYLLRNSILPQYTGFVTSLVGLFGGAVILEEIFTYTGMGFYTFQAAEAGDIPMVLATFVLFTTAVVFALFFVDLTYNFIDPRAEGVGTDESF